MAKAETKIVHQILEGLREKYSGAYLRKIHGNPFQHAGIPDIVGCIHGHFIGLEVKTTQGRVSRIQELEGIAILGSDGIHGVVTDLEEAINIIEGGFKRLKFAYSQEEGLG